MVTLNDYKYLERIALGTAYKVDRLLSRAPYSLLSTLRALMKHLLRGDIPMTSFEKQAMRRQASLVRKVKSKRNLEGIRKAIMMVGISELKMLMRIALRSVKVVPDTRNKCDETLDSASEEDESIDKDVETGYESVASSNCSYEEDADTTSGEETDDSGESQNDCKCSSGTSGSEKDGDDMSTDSDTHQESTPACSLSCEQCGQTFPNDDLRQKHMQLHSEYMSRPYVCDLCGRRYVSVTALKNHRRLKAH